MGMKLVWPVVCFAVGRREELAQPLFLHLLMELVWLVVHVFVARRPVLAWLMPQSQVSEVEALLKAWQQVC